MSKSEATAGAAGEWVDAGALEALPEGRPALLRHAGRRLAVVRTADGVHAVDDRCPHEGYPLTQGTVDGVELTCCYHNFKFDLRTGACPRGEAVPVFETRTRGDRVEVFVPAPDPAAERAAAEASLLDGLYEGRDGQVARDAVRLIQSGATPAEIVALAARFDAERGPFGCSHVVAVAADVLPLCARYPGPLAVRPLMQCLELAGDSNRRRPPRPVASPIDPGPDPAAAEARYRAAMEAERAAEVEGLVRGALARGWGRAEIEPWFYGPCCAHFLDFAHGLIYATKVFDVLDAAGWQHAESLLVGVALEQLNATRDDVLPAWGWWRKAMETARSRFDEWWAKRADADAGPSAVDEDLVAALLGSDRAAAFDATAAALAAGRLPAVLDALVAAAAERVRRFDPAIDLDDTVQDGWLDVTHLFTFAQAIRVATQRHPRPEVLALLFQAARMIQNAGVLDRARTDPADAIPLREPDLDPLRVAIAARDPHRAEGLLRGWLAADLPLAPLRAMIEDLPLHDAYVRPIVVAHAVKTTAAAFAEHARRPDDARPLAALARFVASPIRERSAGARAHEAVRFIVEGKVPRLLS